MIYLSAGDRIDAGQISGMSEWQEGGHAGVVGNAIASKWYPRLEAILPNATSSRRIP